MSKSVMEYVNSMEELSKSELDAIVERRIKEESKNIFSRKSEDMIFLEALVEMISSRADLNNSPIDVAIAYRSTRMGRFRKD